MTPPFRAIAVAALAATMLLAAPGLAYQGTPINASQYDLAAGLLVDRVFTTLAGVRGITLDPLSDAVLAVIPGSRRLACLRANATRPFTALDFTETIADTLDTRPNHGVAVDSSRRQIYLSSPQFVYRWRWEGCGNASTPQNTDSPVIVIRDIPPQGHYTRTLEVDPGLATFLYISVGSYGNLLAGENRATLWRYPLSTLAAIEDSANALVFPAGAELVATGLRNIVAFRFGPGGIWSIDNGSDDLERADLGGSIYVDNPGEEVNVIPIPSSSSNSKVPDFGFPMCFSEFLLPSPHTSFRGNQWSVTGENYTASAANDAICRNPARNVPPVFLLPPHTAPLDLAIVENSTSKLSRGDMLVATHGSWNRPVPQGYALYLVRGLASSPLTVTSTTKYEVLFGDSDLTKCRTTAERINCIRPVGVVIDRQGGIWVSIDSVGQVIRLVEDPSAPALVPVSSAEGGIGTNTVKPSGAASSSSSLVTCSLAAAVMAGLLLV
ncbi:hypothetical protein DFJ74DRAFT_643837 [Hyaloraphidium curvatum]|nr:hypothetical protein DFJ74DRAFT_643837 [Hyaloraphidium curvatum]